MGLRQRKYLVEAWLPKEDSDRAVAIHHAIRRFQKGESEKKIRKMIEKVYGRDKNFVDRVMKRAKVRFKELERWKRR